MLDPLIILAPGRSYTSLVSAMLGQHPELYGVLELNLNAADHMRDWWTTFGYGRGVNAHGLLRTVAQLVYGQQTEATVLSAWQWLRAHLDWPTAALHQMLLETVEPRHVVEKSPVAVHDDRELLRLLETFPDARFLHLLRHPKGTCNSIVQTEWARQMFVMAHPDQCDFSTNPPAVDPQKLWYDTHVRILRFCERLAPGQVMRMSGETLLADPGRRLREIAAWLGLRQDDAAIDEMMHPERSPFSCLGPRNAFAGTDIGFLQSPALRPFEAKPQTLEGPLPWRPDGGGFAPELKELARGFGYV